MIYKSGLLSKNISTEEVPRTKDIYAFENPLQKYVCLGYDYKAYMAISSGYWSLAFYYIEYA